MNALPLILMAAPSLLLSHPLLRASLRSRGSCVSRWPHPHSPPHHDGEGEFWHFGSFGTGGSVQHTARVLASPSQWGGAGGGAFVAGQAGVGTPETSSSVNARTSSGVKPSATASMVQASPVRRRIARSVTTM